MDPLKVAAISTRNLIGQPDGNTIITGCLPHQSALFGLLLRLRDLGMTLVSVNPIASEEIRIMKRLHNNSIPQLIVLIIFFLNGCSGKLEPTSTPTVSLPEPTSTVFEAQTITAIFHPLQPSLTAHPTVQHIVSTPTNSTIDINQDVLEQGVSPDKYWIWVLEHGQQVGNQEYITIHFMSKVGHDEWRVQADASDSGHPAGTKIMLRPLFWMPKEPYVFLAGEACCSDEPRFFTNGRSLYRLNLETGQFSMIYPWGKLYHFSFSSSGKYLLSTSNGTPLVRVTRLKDGQEVHIKLPESYDSAGNTIWAPDGRHVLLRGCDHAQDYSCRKTPLIIIDPDRPEFQGMVSDLYQALEMGEGDQENISWEDSEHVRLSGPKYALVFDIRTGKLIKQAK
jgi:hypothetical protein